MVITSVFLVSIRYNTVATLMEMHGMARYDKNYYHITKMKYYII